MPVHPGPACALDLERYTAPTTCTLVHSTNDFFLGRRTLQQEQKAVPSLMHAVRTVT